VRIRISLFVENALSANKHILTRYLQPFKEEVMYSIQPTENLVESFLRYINVTSFVNKLECKSDYE
jgi:hypothetical protein